MVKRQHRDIRQARSGLCQCQRQLGAGFLLKKLVGFALQLLLLHEGYGFGERLRNIIGRERLFHVADRL